MHYTITDKKKYNVWDKTLAGEKVSVDCNCLWYLCKMHKTALISLAALHYVSIHAYNGMQLICDWYLPFMVTAWHKHHSCSKCQLSRCTWQLTKTQTSEFTQLFENRCIDKIHSRRQIIRTRLEWHSESANLRECYVHFAIVFTRCSTQHHIQWKLTYLTIIKNLSILSWILILIKITTNI